MDRVICRLNGVGLVTAAGDDFSKSGLLTPVTDLLNVFFLTTSRSGVDCLSSPVRLLGNIFLKAGGVTTRGMNDLLVASVGAGVGLADDLPLLVESGVRRFRAGENFGMRLFFSPELLLACRLGVDDRVSGEGARLLPAGWRLG